MSALGTYRGTVNDLLPSAMVSEDDEPFDDTTNSESATKSSDPIISMGMNSDVAHSTVIINAPCSPDPIDTQDETLPGTILYSRFRHTRLNFILGAPLAYSGSVCSTHRASYATRTSVDGAGTVLTPAGLGTGVDTISPRCAASSETARAGGLMVDEVILPILTNVRFPRSSSRDFSPTSVLRLSGMIWTLERLNP